jgi:hypothetical protein
MKTISAAIATPDMPIDPGVQLVVFPGVDRDAIRSRDGADLITQAAAYAALRRVFVVAGLYIKNNTLCLGLLDEQGQLVLEQAATHLNPTWTAGLQQGYEIRVVDTPLGKIALCVDVDVYKGEVMRIAALQGAEIVVSCQVIPSQDYHRSMILAGAWQQAQQNCLFVINANNLNGSIIGPCETTTDLSGFLAEISSEYPLQALLSAEKRAAAYRSFPIFKSLNPPLYHRHQDELCQ